MKKFKRKIGYSSEKMKELKQTIKIKKLLGNVKGHPQYKELKNYFMDDGELKKQIKEFQDQGMKDKEIIRYTMQYIARREGRI